MTGHHIRTAAAGSDPSFIKRCRGREQCGLRVHRQAEHFRRTFCDEFDKIFSESSIGASHIVRNDSIVGKTRKHADRLAALAGEYECNAHEFFPLVP